MATLGGCTDFFFFCVCVCVLVRFSDDHEFTLICVIIDFIRLSTTCNKNKYSLIMLGLSNMFNFLARFFDVMKYSLVDTEWRNESLQDKELGPHYVIRRHWEELIHGNCQAGRWRWYNMIEVADIEKMEIFFSSWKCSSLQENWNESQIALKEGDYVTAKMRLR